jgi:hypothetical protein
VHQNDVIPPLPPLRVFASTGVGPPHLAPDWGSPLLRHPSSTFEGPVPRSSVHVRSYTVYTSPTGGDESLRCSR